MRDTNLVKALREHAEWAEGNQWETPITLGDDLAKAADRLENQNAHIAAIQQEIEKLRAQLRQLCRNCDLDRLEELAKADRAGRLVVLPCKVGDTIYFRTYDCNGTIDLGIQPHKVTAIVGHAIVRGKYTDVGLSPGQYGVSWFLTREEAENVLKTKEG